MVEASLGDSLLKLGLAKKAISDVGHSGETTTGHLKDFNRSMDHATIASARAGDAIIRAGRLIHETDGFLSNTTTDATLFERALLGITDVFGGGGAGGGGGLLAALGSAVPLFAGLSIPLGALPILIGAVAIAVVALTDALGTLIAILADLVAPLTLVTGLLGLLAAGFVIAAKRAFTDTGALGPAVEQVKHQFDNLTKQLVTDFMPVFKFLISSVHDALTYFNQLAKMPLTQAFQSLSTTGVKAATRFVEQVGAILAHPFRLAVKLAFGAGASGSDIANSVSNLWNQFTRYMLGYADTHPVFAKDGKFLGITTTHIQGALQPLLDWFNRHHFTKQGIEIGHDILDGILRWIKAHWGDIARFLITIFMDAATTVGVATGRLIATGINRGLRAVDAYVLGLWNRAKSEAASAARSMAQSVRSALTSAWNAVKSAATSIWGSIRSAASSAISSIASSITGKLASAWNSVKSDAASAWNYIKGLFSQALSLHISVPHISLPSLPSVPGLASGGSAVAGRAYVIGERGPELFVPQTSGQVIPNHRMGGVTVNIIAADLSTPAAQRRIAHTIGRHVLNEWGQASGTV